MIEPIIRFRITKVRRNIVLTLLCILNYCFTNSSSFLLPRTARTRIKLDTRLNFFGTERVEVTRNVGSDSSGIVDVRIERTSQNSRRLGGEIIVDAPIDDVWTILTDYDNLSTHVPNLVESRRIRSGTGEQGDGTYECRLYQKGAQNIIGFEFAASVTMDMVEKISSLSKFSGQNQLMRASSSKLAVPVERKIRFRCVDSPFFSVFDGEWKVTGSADGKSTTLNYVVDVRPRGPVPVAALEWRIREDVPSNLRAVKDAAIKFSRDSMQKLATEIQNKKNVNRAIARNVKLRARKLVGHVMKKQPQFVPVVIWDDEETMATYLRD